MPRIFIKFLEVLIFSNVIGKRDSVSYRVSSGIYLLIFAYKDHHRAAFSIRTSSVSSQ